MAGKVGNLRAMFEQNKADESTSPPQHRGRSPGSTGLFTFTHWQLELQLKLNRWRSKHRNFASTPLQDSDELCNCGEEWTDGTANAERYQRRTKRIEEKS